MELPIDIFARISLTLDDPMSWRNWRLTSSVAYKSTINDSRFRSQCLLLILAMPDANWDWNALSKRAPLSFITAYPDFRWDWGLVTEKAAVSIKCLIENPTLPWNWEYLTYRTTYSTRIRLLDIIQNPHLMWDYGVLSAIAGNINTLVLENPDKSWDWSALSNNMTIESAVILQTAHKPWDFAQLFANDRLPEALIHKLLDESNENTCWDDISKSKKVPASIMAAYSDKPWNWNAAISAKKITAEFIVQHPEIAWNYGYISRHMM